MPAKRKVRSKVRRLLLRARANGEEITLGTAKLRLLKKLKCTQKYEKAAWVTGAQLVAGVDEVGRGCLFGPVVAAAVILKADYRIRGLRDSKLLLPATREKLAERIREHAIAISIASVDVETIDRINIYHATRTAMLNAVAGLSVVPDHLLVDAMVVDFPSAEQRLPQTKLIYGDALSISIAAASIVAKVERDRMMREIAPQYPQYDIASNKGYRSPKHLAALAAIGPSTMHRKSFAPVWNSLQNELRFAESALSEIADAELSAEMLTADALLEGDAIEPGLDS